jgi:hypothetical protein
MADTVFVPKMSFWLDQNPSEPLFGKEGYGEILWRINLFKKIPLNPPLLKGEDTRKDSRQAGMTDGLMCFKIFELIEVANV